MDDTYRSILARDKDQNHLSPTVAFYLYGRSFFLEDRKIVLEPDAKARDWLAARGYDPAYGARPLKRTIQNLVQNPMARSMLAGDIVDGDTVVIDKGAEGIVFKKK